MKPRNFIFECYHGSKLYGTSTPSSDTDYRGVFLPSAEELLSIRSYPKELKMDEKVSSGDKNDSLDTDRTYFSLPRFFSMALEGQPMAIEMLFAPTLRTSPEWKKIQSARNIFLSKIGVKPFIGFAMAQSYKAMIKGETLNRIRRSLDLCEQIRDIRSKVGDHEWPDLEPYTNDSGYSLYRIAGRSFDPGIIIKDFRSALQALHDRYGNRVKAASTDGYDYKSLSHAVRIVKQAEEFITTGALAFPSEHAELIKQIKFGKIEKDWHQYLQDEVARLGQLNQETHVLPDEPDYRAADQLCVEILKGQFYEYF